MVVVLLHYEAFTGILETFFVESIFIRIFAPSFPHRRSPSRAMGVSGWNLSRRERQDI